MASRNQPLSLVAPALVWSLLFASTTARTLAAETGAPGGPPADAARRLAGRAVGASPLLDDLRELCDRVGGRPAGSKQNERAVEWGAAKLRAAGADSVKLEAFAVSNLWLPGTAEASCTAPESFPIRIVAAPFSPSTAGKGLEAPVVDAGLGTEEEFKQLGERARGAIALVRNGEMKSVEDLFGEYMKNGSILAGARKAQVAAVLIQSSRPRGLLYRHPISLTGAPAPMPVAMVSREAFTRVLRLAQAGEVRLSLSISNRLGGSYESKNVVAEISGSEKPEEIVLLGAHLDSWDLGTGANDNGVNAALVIDVLRGIHELGLRPRRTIRVVLFNAEEQGMWGSEAYVKKHAGELDRHVAAVVFDVGSGRTNGFYLNGREELRAPVNQALSAVAGLQAFDHTLEAVDGTDNFDFLLAGVPNLVASQDWAPYLPDYHAESDTFDKVDPREARANAAIASALVWGLAESPARAARQSRAQVEKLIVETKLDAQMKAFGQWDDWTAGRRGVSASPK